MKSKKIVITSILTLIAIVLIVGISYAITNFSNFSSINGINSGHISFTYTEPTNSYDLINVLPLSDDDGMIQTNYFEFSVSSNFSTNANDDNGVYIPYEISITPQQLDSGKTAIGDTNIKVYLTKVENGKEIMVTAPTLISSLKNSDYLANSKEVAYNLNSHHNNNGSVTTTYRLRAWIIIDNSITDWTTTGQYQYKFKVNVNGKSNPIGYYETPISCFTFSTEAEDDSFINDLKSATYYGIDNKTMKISGFSEDCDATNIVIPSQVTTKVKYLEDIVITNERAALQNYYQVYNQGETYQEFLKEIGYDTEDEAIEAHAIYNVIDIDYVKDKFKNLNYYDYQGDFNYYIEMLEEYVGSNNYELIFSDETLEQFEIGSIATDDFKNRDIKTMIVPEEIQFLREDLLDGNDIDLLIDEKGHFPKGCFVFDTMEDSDNIQIEKFKCQGAKNVDIQSSYTFKNVVTNSNSVNLLVDYMYDIYQNTYNDYLNSATKEEVKTMLKALAGNQNMTDEDFLEYLNSSDGKITFLPIISNLIEAGVFEYDGTTFTKDVGSFGYYFLQYSIPEVNQKSVYKNAKIKNLTIHNNVITDLYGYFYLGRIEHLNLSDTIITTITGKFSNGSNKTNLKTISFPNSLTTIGDNAFENNQIEGLDFSNTSLTSIGDKAFRSNYSIGKLVLPSTVTSIGDYAFESNKLKELNLSNTQLVAIGDYTFSFNKLENFSLPNSLTSIGNSSFANNEIKEVDLSNKNIISIDAWAFSDNKIEQIKFPSTLTTLEGGVFSNNKLETINLPSTVTSIGSNTFRNNNLKVLDLSNTGITSIGEHAFEYNQLEKVNLPSTVISIQSNAFSKNDSSNPNLKSIIYPGTTPLKWDSAINGNYSYTTVLPPVTINGVSITAN